MPETVSLKEALRAALDADDAREAAGGTAQPVVTPIVEAVERSEMTFVEDAGVLIPVEVEA